MKLRTAFVAILVAVFVAGPEVASGQPRTDEIVKMSDGVGLETTIIRPAGLPPDGGFPGIVLVHGYGGRKDNMLPVAAVIAAYGYASISYSVRGQGNSGGLSEIDGPRETEDLGTIIEHFRRSANINSERIGVTGGSQGGIHSWMAAVHRMPGVKAVAPLIATPDFARTLVPNGTVRYALPLEMNLGSVRYGPDRDRVRELIIADAYDSILAYINARDLMHLVDSVRVPVLQMLGWADFIFPANGGIHAAERISTAGVPVWSYYGTNGHGESVDQTEATYQLGLVVRWFDHWLKGFSLPEDSLRIVYYSDDRAGWPRHVADTWPPHPSSSLRLYFSSTGLTPAPSSEEAVLPFSLAYNSDYSPRSGWNDLYGGSRFVSAFQSSPARMLSLPLSGPVEITGIPTGRITVASDASKFQANVRIFDVDGDNSWTLISRSVNGIRRNSAWQRHDIYFEANALSHVIPAGHRIGVEVTSLDLLHADRANTIPYFLSSRSELVSPDGNPPYLDLPIVGSSPGFAGVANDAAAPREFALGQNYPNPFNPGTTIRFSLPTRSAVKLSVYNLLGQEVATVYEGDLAAGTYAVQFNGSSLASGVYFYRLTAGTHTETKRMTILK